MDEREKHLAVLIESMACADAWEGEARLLGNVRAIDLSKALDYTIKQLRAMPLMAAKARCWDASERSGAATNHRLSTKYGNGWDEACKAERAACSALSDAHAALRALEAQVPNEE